LTNGTATKVENVKLLDEKA